LGATAANRPQSVLQFTHFGGAAANTSHGSESSSRCSAQQEKQSVNIEELSDSSEEEPKRRQRINWSEEENERLFNSWIHHSTDPVIGIDRKCEYYWKVVAAEFNDNAPKIATRDQSNN